MTFWKKYFSGYFCREFGTKNPQAGRTTECAWVYLIHYKIIFSLSGDWIFKKRHSASWFLQNYRLSL